MNKNYKVIVPHKSKLISYPGRGLFYSKLEAVAVMESFEKKCSDRVKRNNKLEIWAESERNRFTLADYREDFLGIRTGDI